jgi:ATPase subunit of ABC transporter with duplicated ATPase domains
VANVVFEVKEGRIRKFSGGFDYYLEKKDQSEVLLERKAPKIDALKQKQEEERALKKEEERRKKEEEKKRKSHNTAIGDKIKKLERKIENLNLESYAKARAMSDPKIFRDEETVKSYGRRLKDIEKEIEVLSIDIEALKKQLI